MHASRKLTSCLLLCVFTTLAGCVSGLWFSWDSYSLNSVTFDLPADWKPVSNRNGTLFAPVGVSYEKSQIEIRVRRNFFLGVREVRQDWMRQREAAERSSQLIAVNKLTLNSFEAFEIVRRSPAPSTELIPIEYQVAGDQVFHQVEIIGGEYLLISAHLLVEEAEYDKFLDVFQGMLNSIRMEQGS
jgi:hypothetical protein